MIDKCPYCGCDEEYTENYIVRFSQCYDYTGEPTCATDNMPVRGGKRKYCCSCLRDITKAFNNIEEEGNAGN